MDGYTKQLKKILKKNGCYLVRTGNGDHEIWFSPVSKIHFTVDGKILSRHTANAVMKQAGFSKQF